jgi:hypothetical protein
VILTPPERRWVCPNCTTTDVTRRADVHTQFHHCAGLAGLWSPLLLEGERARVRAVERQDYVGVSRPKFDGNGRPIMAVDVERDDGNDVVIFVPPAGAAAQPGGF